MKEYQLGDTWSSDFDYDGMLQKGMEAEVTWPIEDLQELYHSFEDVNYHREAGYLYGAIQEIKKGYPSTAMTDLENFNNECTKTLTGWNA
jgi:hypothetical protein